MPRTTYTKSCAQCGAMFTTIDPRQRFCRRACLHAHQSQLFADRVTSFARARQDRARKIVATVAIIASVGLGMLATVEPDGFPLVPAATSAETRNSELEVPATIGDLVDHSTTAVFLAPDYGLALMYYGGFAGTPWPDAADAERTLQSIRRARGATFFVVTDMSAWAARPELHAFLKQYPLVAADRDFRVYDIR